ncbi:Allantoicase [Coemansia javaensis]|uniref:Allantoicase n=1 Tax=Coemansia javaensis TaxID=2761396 RepID=A0A9W8LE48_9FUNG|nr:Allantoicase [Coemansia javaensis]
MGNVQSSLPTYYNADPTNEAYTHSLSDYVDLASAAVGAKVIRSSNERFGAASNLIKAEAPESADGKADAWVTQRHNPEADWAVVRLGSTGTVAGFDIDTRGLDGEHASVVSVQGCLAAAGAAVDARGNVDGAEWEELLPEVDIGANSRHLLALWTPTAAAYSHMRLMLHPDGGVARLRILGTVVVDPSAEGELDLASVNAGARVVQASDDSLGRKENLILPGRATSASRSTQGWKTRRSRDEGHSDWAIVRLGEPGFLTRIELDTLFFDGDQPVSAAVQACYTEMENPERDPECFWYQIVPRTEVNGNRLHKIDVSLNDVPFSHIKLVIHPDGGIGRLRAFGQRVKEIEAEAAREKAEAAAEASLAAEIGADSSEQATDAEAPSATFMTPQGKMPSSMMTPAKASSSKAPNPFMTPTKAPAPAPDAAAAERKKAKKQASRKKAKAASSSKAGDSKDGTDDDQFSSPSNELIQSLTSPLPQRKRALTRTRAADDDSDGASVGTAESQPKRARRKAKARAAATANIANTTS